MPNAGMPPQSIWDDTWESEWSISMQIYEAPQEPMALLGRKHYQSILHQKLVILYLHPGCGCGTTLEAAQLLGRKWIPVLVFLSMPLERVSAVRLKERYMPESIFRARP